MIHGSKKPKAKKVLAGGPKKVGNHGQKSMGTTIGKGKTMQPKGSDRSKVSGNSKDKFNARKYAATRRAVFGLV